MQQVVFHDVTSCLVRMDDLGAEYLLQEPRLKKHASLKRADNTAQPFDEMLAALRRLKQHKPPREHVSKRRCASGKHGFGSDSATESEGDPMLLLLAM